MNRKARSKDRHRAPFDMPAIRREIDYIIGRVLRLEGRVVSLGPLIFFSTDSGDAWMLDPSDGGASCLARDGARHRLPRVKDRGARSRSSGQDRPNRRRRIHLSRCDR